MKIKKLLILSILLSTSLSMVATHYINNTGKTITVTNVTAKKRTRKSYFSFLSKKNRVEPQDITQNATVVYFIELENGAQGDLDNNQGDEVAITSSGISDKRKLFPTNNSFNYVITMNKYKSIFEKFDINHAE